MKKQTAVEFIMDKLNLIDKNAYNELYNDGYAQAIEMEKNQIIDAHLSSSKQICKSIELWSGINSYQYFNDTYNNDTQ